MPADVALRRLGRALVGRLDETIQEYVARMRAEVPEFFLSDDPVVVDALRESARANYIVAFNALSGGREVPEHAPAAAVDEARVAAEAGVALPTLLKSYYVGHAVAWERILLEVERLDLDTETRSAVLQLTSRYAFSYVERISVLVTDEYTRARQSLVRSRDRLRARLVSDMLEGLPADEEALGYGLGQWHLAAVTWGERPEGALAALADVLEGQLLTLPGPFGTLWGWIGASVAAADGQVDRFAAPPDTCAALGDPGRGRAGFRRSHHQAQGARVVALRTGEPVTRWHAVALEALTLHDEEAARAFVREELGSLAGADARDAVLRATLAAWFAAEHRSVGAAALLGVHERTVTYRLRTIEERLGHPILSRRTELGAALRLRDHCGLRG